ncbi:hypothetical protein ACIGH6_13430 [Brachybacterium paraconglomeratum]|uniref:hypothetical protein n=1 Tax=Brachybacterium paraconglomeratum TaxID=173362 RepID=UPI0037CBBAC0
MTAVMAGLIGVGGSLCGVLLSTFLGSRAERRKLAETDARRWLEDRRRVYADFLLLSQSMSRQIEIAALNLPYDDSKSEDEDARAIRVDQVYEYYGRWDDELQVILAEIMLVGGADVADMASRVSDALMDLGGFAEVGGYFVDFYPKKHRTDDLIGLLRNTMRGDLGNHEGIGARPTGDAEWPWPSSIPDEIEYVRRQTEIPHRPELTRRESERLLSAGLDPRIIHPSHSPNENE